MGWWADVVTTREGEHTFREKGRAGTTTCALSRQSGSRPLVRRAPGKPGEGWRLRETCRSRAQARRTNTASNPEKQPPLGPHGVPQSRLSVQNYTASAQKWELLFMADWDTTVFPRWRFGRICENDKDVDPPTRQPQFRDFVPQTWLHTRQVHLLFTAPSSRKQKVGHSSKVEGIHTAFAPEPSAAGKGVTAPSPDSPAPAPRFVPAFPHSAPTKGDKKVQFLDPSGDACRPGVPCRVLGFR